MNDQELKTMLEFDPLDSAERISGKSYKEDENTIRLGMGLAFLSNGEKSKTLLSLDDTTFTNELSRYQRIVGEEGFVKLLEIDIPPTMHCGSIVADTKFFIYWHDDGMLLAFDTYFAGSVNGAKLYAQIQYDDWSSFRLRCTNGPLDVENTRYVNFDGREALRFHIREIRSAGRLLRDWRPGMFLWLLHWADTQTEGYDHKATNRERIAMLPDDIQKRINYTR